MSKKQGKMPDEPLKESFHPWFIHKISTDKEFAGYDWVLRMDENGKQKRVLVYHGAHYYFNYRGAELHRKRVRVGLLTGFSLALMLIACGAITTSGVSNGVLSCCELFALIPAIYQVMGLWTLCTCKEPFEMRVPMLSVRRMKSSGLGILVLDGIAWVLNLYFAVVNRGTGRTAADLLFAAVMGACLILQILLRRELLTFHLLNEDGEPLDSPSSKAEQEPSDESSPEDTNGP